MFTRSYAGQDAALGSSDGGLGGSPTPASADGPPSSESEPASDFEPATDNSVDQPDERALALWDAGSTDDLPAALPPPLDALDARAVAALVRARLRGAGVSAVRRGSLPATRANPAGLTARQLDVLSLLADGLTTSISPRGW